MPSREAASARVSSTPVAQRCPIAKVEAMANNDIGILCNGENAPSLAQAAAVEVKHFVERRERFISKTLRRPA